MKKSGLSYLGKYTLIVTEKPDAACRIAVALDLAGKADKIVVNGVPHYVAKRKKDIVVVPALGHLYTVAGEKRKGQLPLFRYQWVPLYVAKRGAKRIRNWLETITKLAKDADAFIDACDYDIEGSIIGYCILKYACGNKENSSKRMKYSTLTKEAIEKSFNDALPHLDFALIEAGLTRHEVDWLYGINLSKALTTAAKKYSGKYTTLSTGRVQGPTLKFLSTRERSIKSFVPTPYWSIKAVLLVGNSVLEAEYEKKVIEHKEEAVVAVNACKGKNGKIERIDTKKFRQIPPPPFDLGSLQSEAYRLFRCTPMRTSKIAQRLYLGALISYPRTSSQKLPPIIDYKEILKKLSKTRDFNVLAAELLAMSRLKPNEGKAEDLAHPAIHPTGNLPEKALNRSERNIWNLVVRRFMASFGEPALQQTVNVTISIDGQRFHLRGRQILDEGWLHFYKKYTRPESPVFPMFKEGQKVRVKRVLLADKFSQPPPRYNPSSLLRKMEKEKIGTKATRAGIIQKLYDRKYIYERNIVVTDLGWKVIEVLEKYCPKVVSPELTRKLEEKMTAIQQGKEKKEAVVQNAIKILKPILKKLKENEQIIGSELTQSLKKSVLEEKTIGTCRTCNDGKLVLLYSRKTGKRFVGCTNYFEGQCKTAFPLPQRGSVKPSGKVCESCSLPIVRVQMRGRRAWNQCLNPNCPLNQRGISNALQYLR